MSSLFQAKKFGTFSCEPCRKFISKTIKRVNSKTDEEEDAAALFTCIDGKGECVVVAPAGKKEGEGRCQACWLKLCLIG